MKKQILSVLIIICLAVSLTACKKNNDSGINDGGNSQGDFEGVLYAPGSSLSVVFADDDISDPINVLLDAVGAVTGTVPTLSKADTAQAKHEIVIGMTERAISKAAYEKLEKIDKETEYEVSYLVYSDGNSVAIAFEKDEYGHNVALDKAVSAFIGYMGTDETLSLKTGKILQGTIDPLDVIEERDAKKIEEKWAVLKTTIGIKLATFSGPFFDGEGNEVDKDTYVDLVVTELKNMYSLYTDDVIEWFANLYEPNGGGYYFSNSARNTVGYLPDIESTSQALNFWAGSGMANEVGGTYANAIPEWMKEQIIYFVKNLQDPNGYFYHPQWGKELLDNKPARRNRDLEWACGILSQLGAKPTYKTPSGMEGDGILANGESVVPASKRGLTSMLSSSVAMAVSKIIAVDSSETAVSDNLKTKEAFAEYLEKLDIRNNCYGGGNELGTFASQIKARDKQLKEQNAGWSPIDMVIEYLNENCYPETGHWSSVADYNGTNGLLKISGLYNSLGAEMPYPLEAARSAIASITTDERAQTICYVYNAWFSVTNIIDNLKYYSSNPNGASLANGISASLLTNCVSGIIASREKTATFKRDDGSFSYLTTGSSTNAQGMPVAVPQSLEGDVNATEIGIVGTWSHMLTALGLSKDKIPLYTESDRIRYIRILEKLGPVIKDPEDTDIDVMTFDDDDVGQSPYYVELNFNSSGSATVERNADSKNDKLLHFKSANNGGDELTFACDSLRLGASCFAFRFDMKVDSATSGNFLQLILGNKCYMLMFSNDASGIHISDISSGSTPRLMNDFGVTVGFGEWHNYRVEYYIGNEETVRIKVFVDNILVGVTDNYYDSTAARLNGKVGTPLTSYTEASILALSYANCDAYIDNVSCYKTNEIYQPIIDENNQPNINIDAPTDEQVVSAPGDGVYFSSPEYVKYNNKFTYDYMGYPSPSLSGPACGKMFCRSGMLVFERIASAGEGETYIQYKSSAPSDLTAYTNYCSIYEFDFRVSEADLSYDNAPFRLDGGNYIRFVKNSDGETWSLAKKDSAEIKCGEWCNIRFEVYYINELSEIVKIFVNGEYATELALGEVSPFNSRLIMYMKTRIDKGTVINVDNMIIIHLDKVYVSEEPSEDEDTEQEGGEDGGSDAENTDAAPGNGVYYNSTSSAAAYRQWNFNTTGTLNGFSGSSFATGKYVNGAAVLERTASDWATAYFYYNIADYEFIGDTSSANCKIFEFDYKMSDMFSGSNDGRALFRLDGNDYVKAYRNSDGTTLSLGEKDTMVITPGEWCNIRFEFYNEDGVKYVKIYVNNTYGCTQILNDKTNTFNNRIYFQLEAATVVGCTVSVDNLVMAYINK